MKFKALIAASAVAIAFSATPANALTSFVINGTLLDGNAYNASFTLPDSPVTAPDNFIDGYAFWVSGVPFAASSNGFASIQFFNDDPVSAGGGILIVDEGDFFTYLFDATDGQQYYTGLESAPTFLPGTYTLDGLSTRGAFTLSISQIAAVPEPATWAMMVGGFAFVGAALRRRRNAYTAAVRFA